MGLVEDVIPILREAAPEFYPSPTLLLKLRCTHKSSDPPKSPLKRGTLILFPPTVYTQVKSKIFKLNQYPA